MTRAIMALTAMVTLAVPPAAMALRSYAEVSYTYPAQARAIPALKQWLDRQAAALRTDTIAQATSDRADAKKDGRTFIPYTADRSWQVVTDTPRFLSLSQTRSDFTGGAHGNTNFSAMVWDRQTSARLTPLSFFTSPGALSAAIKSGFCRQLQAQRAEKRDGDVKSGTEIDEFDKCIDPITATVILGSSTHQKFDRIGILIAPYQAGPYVEGTYEATLPVTPAVLAAVKPEWRGYFAIKAGTP